MIFMKKTLLWLTIFLLGCALVSCAVPGNERSTSSEDLLIDTTGTPDDWIPSTPAPTEYSTTGFGCCTTQSTCETGKLPVPESYYAPNDEEKTHLTYTVTNAEGLTLEVILYGYRSDIIGKNLYFKYGEPIPMKIRIQNNTDAPIYQYLPTQCHESIPHHAHEIAIFLQNSHSNVLVNSVELLELDCLTAEETWCLDIGEVYEMDIELLQKPEHMIAWDDVYQRFFDLDDNRFHTVYESPFSGKISFIFGNDADTMNDSILSLPLTLHVLHIEY